MKGMFRKLTLTAAMMASVAFLLSGCSGSDGSNGTNGTNGLNGADGKDLTATVKVSELTSDQWAALSLKGEVTGVTIAGAPVVKFKVTDSLGRPVVGLASSTKASSALVASYPNVSFNLAKLVPAVNNADGTPNVPSKWVNYLVTTVPTVAAPTVVPTQPTTDANGTLVDNGDGNYTYTFYRDITKTKEIVDAATVTAPKVIADLGDLTYDPALTHRLAVRITGSMPGTGTNTADGVQVTPGVSLAKPIVLIYDFIPATGAKVTATDTARLITTNESCASCHGGVPGHRGADTRNCVLCHNDQIKYGRANVDSVAGVVAGTAAGAPRGYRIDGETLANFPIMIHKLHMGSSLTKSGFGYNIVGVDLKSLAYPQERDNCRKCHVGDTSAQLAVAPQANNWKNNPSRMACGSCHDNINFATGTNLTAGGAAHFVVTDDKTCVLCHSAANVETYHTNLNATPNNPNVPVGAANFTYEVSNLTVNGSNQPVVKFRIMKVTPPATAATAVKLDTVSGTNPLSGFTGAPSFLVAYALPQDGITSPADFNNLGNGTLGAQPVSVSIAKLCDTTITATGTTGTQGSMTGPDTDGYYTATLNGPATTIRETVYGATTATAVTATETVQGLAKGTAKTTVGMLASPAMPANPARFPAGAKLRTVALQGYFTQVSPAVARHSTMVMKSVSGESRRLVVDSAKCAQCHEFFEGHGGNRNYNMDGCTVCHNPNLSSSGTIINDPTAPEATQNLKDMIHSIHAGSMRENAYKHTRSKSGSNTVYDWSGAVYPNDLINCESCHKPGTYGSVPAGALATTDVTPSNGVSVFDARVLLPNTTDKVISPFSAACVSCHDSSAAKAHIAQNGGQLSVSRSILSYPSTETCAVCHSAGKAFDVTVVHK